MTELQTVLPVERVEAADAFEAILDARLEHLVASYEARWLHLAPLTRSWLHEVLGYAVYYVRADLLYLVRELLAPPPPTVH